MVYCSIVAALSSMFLHTCAQSKHSSIGSLLKHFSQFLNVVMAWHLPTYPVFFTPKCHPVHYVPLLSIPPSRLRMMGDRAFSVAGPTLWNLPHSLNHN